MRLKVVLARDLCESNGTCVLHAPEVFALDDTTDELQLLAEYPDEQQLEKVRAAVRGCPKGALALREE
ncbi:MAG TPA: ferredoxin [Polyangiaceae bacterium]|nr:ferredoxin [Polyangiaceae bacterium]